MPSFGHSSKLGTYMKDLGYYFAPNDYLDIETYLDFYDRAKFTIDSQLRYNKQYGSSWYNYRYNGYIDIDNYIVKLSDEDEDFTTRIEEEEDFSSPNEYSWGPLWACGEHF